MSSDEEEYPETIYGCTKAQRKELQMAGGGSHAWWYYLYDNDYLYIKRWNEKEEYQHNMWLVYDMEGQSDNVKMVDSEYQLKESESYVSYHESEEDQENDKLKEEIVKLKAQNAKIKKSEKYVVNLWKQEQDAHSKTLNNIFKNLNLTEEHDKKAHQHADQFDNSKNPEGQYRTMIGNWYWVCYKAISSSSVPHQ